MSTPYEDPIANAIIEFAHAVEKLAEAVSKYADVTLSDVEYEKSKDRLYDGTED